MFNTSTFWPGWVFVAGLGRYLAPNSRLSSPGSCFLPPQWALWVYARKCRACPAGLPFCVCCLKMSIDSDGVVSSGGAVLSLVGYRHSQRQMVRRPGLDILLALT